MFERSTTRVLCDADGCRTSCHGCEDAEINVIYSAIYPSMEDVAMSVKVKSPNMRGYQAGQDRMRLSKSISEVTCHYGW